MWQVPGFIHKLLSSFIWQISSSEKTVYLTFDDGPIPEVTPKILDILDEYNAKATFFCVGENVSKHPDIFAEIINRGHSVGNHTYNHLKGLKTPTKIYIENVEKADKLIQSKLFRPPYGRIKRKQALQLTKKYQLIMWSLITYDYNPKVEVNTIVKEIRRKTKNGSIVLFHDSVKSEKNVIHALPLALQYWQKESYSVKAISYK